MFQNIQKIFTHTPSLITWGVATVLATWLWYAYSDIEYVAGNYQSYGFAYFDMLLSWVMILCLPLIIAGIVYKSYMFGSRNLEKKKGFLGLVSGTFSLFVTGAACCGVSLLSLLGLTSVITFLEIFPYHGIELKTLAIIVLIYSTYDLYQNLEVCHIKIKKPR